MDCRRIVLTGLFIVLCTLQVHAGENEYYGYSEADWVGDPISVDDDLSIGDIDSMTEGYAVDPEGSEEGERNGAIDEVAGSSDAVESCWPYSYNETDSIKSYLKKHLTPTRDQGSYGTCWAHEAIGMAEAYMINAGNKKTSIDYSERHLVYETFAGAANHLGLDGGDSISQGSEPKTHERDLAMYGGNLTYASMTLMRWRGVADESTAMYAQIGSFIPDWSRIHFSDTIRLKNYYILDKNSNAAMVKRYIREYGGVGASIYFDSSVYNSTYDSYNYTTEGQSTNHGVMIVGWDDDFPADRFSPAASGKGAWLVRNSYLDGSFYDSENKGYEAYFWLSYYDKGLAKDMGVFKMQDSGSFSKYNYYYDNTINQSSCKSSNQTIKCANVYKASASSVNEKIDSVSFQTLTASKGGSLDYRIDIYTNLKKDTVPDSGTLVSSQQGVLPFIGSYTIELDTPAYVKKGTKFAAVITLQNGAKSVDFEGGNISYTGTYPSTYKSSAKSGQSFVKYGSNSWKDNTNDGMGNFIIGVQTSDYSGNVSGGDGSLPNTDSADARGLALMIFVLAVSGMGCTYVLNRKC